jgi:ABC-2 type transport system ATP-binding protein
LERAEKSFVVRTKAGRLRRRRQVVRAVDGVSFSVGAGATVGFVGPNGAGKSTTIKMLVGILVPSGGRVRVDGRDPSRDRVEVARRLGVVFGQRSQLWWDLPLGDSFDLLRHVYRVPAVEHRRSRAELVDVLELGGLLATPVRQLSLGQRMRGELVAALLHDPPILLLDEPTIGLDVVSKEAVRGFLATLGERGTTVLLTTHDLADVECLCERLLVIDHGRVIEDSSIDEVKRRYGPARTLVVDLDAPRPPLDVSGAEIVRTEGSRQWLRFHRDEHTAASLLAQITPQAQIRDISVEEPAIDEIVRHIYRSAARADHVGQRSARDQFAPRSP